MTSYDNETDPWENVLYDDVRNVIIALLDPLDTLILARTSRRNRARLAATNKDVKFHEVFFVYVRSEHLLAIYGPGCVAKRSEMELLDYKEILHKDNDTGMRYLVKYYAANDGWTLTNPQFFTNAAELGALRCYQFLHDEFYGSRITDDDKSINACYAIDSGNIALLDFMLDRDYDFSECMPEATQYRSLPVLKWLQGNGLTFFEQEFVDLAAGQASPEILDWLYANGMRFDGLDLDEGVTNPHRASLKWLVAHGVRMSSETLRTATRFCEPATVELLVSMGCPFDQKNALDEAAEVARPATLLFLRDTLHCPASARGLKKAIKYSNFKAIVLFQQFLSPQEFLEGLLQQGPVSLFDSLETHGFRFPNNLCEGATFYGRRDVLQWASERDFVFNGFELDMPETPENAALLGELYTHGFYLKNRARRLVLK